MKGLLGMPSVKMAVGVSSQVGGGLAKEALGSLFGEAAGIPVPVTRQATQYPAQQLASPHVETAAADTQLLPGRLEGA